MTHPRAIPTAHAGDSKIPRHVPADPWTQRVGGYTGLAALIRQLGAEPGEMQTSAGLASDALDDAEGRIPYSAAVRLLRVSAEQTGCAHLGLLAGRMWRLADLGAVGVLAGNSATVADALIALVGNQHLESEGGLSYFIQRDAVAEVGYAIYHPDVFDAGQTFDCILAATFNYMRELCGGDWVPTEVLIPHARPLDVAPYRSFFKAMPTFNSELCALRFPAHWLENAVKGADSERLRAAGEQVSNGGPPALLQQVYRALRLLLLHERHGGDDVARTLAMHRRTLNRRLRAEGTTFQHVLDDVRFTVARELLSASTVSIDDVAAALGYGGVSSFTRTFQRWSGTSPGRWRRSTCAPPSLFAAAGRPQQRFSDHHVRVDDLHLEPVERQRRHAAH